MTFGVSRSLSPSVDLGCLAVCVSFLLLTLISYPYNISSSPLSNFVAFSDGHRLRDYVTNSHLWWSMFLFFIFQSEIQCLLGPFFWTGGSLNRVEQRTAIKWKKKVSFKLATLRFVRQPPHPTPLHSQLPNSIWLLLERDPTMPSGYRGQEGKVSENFGNVNLGHFLWGFFGRSFGLYV